MTTLGRYAHAWQAKNARKRSETEGAVLRVRYDEDYAPSPWLLERSLVDAPSDVTDSSIFPRPVVSGKESSGKWRGPGESLGERPA